jgi:hypothetical protein
MYVLCFMFTGDTRHTGFCYPPFCISALSFHCHEKRDVLPTATVEAIAHDH